MTRTSYTHKGVIYYIESEAGKYRFYIPSLRPAFQYGGWQDNESTAQQDAKRMIGW